LSGKVEAKKSSREEGVWAAADGAMNMTAHSEAIAMITADGRFR